MLQFAEQYREKMGYEDIVEVGAGSHGESTAEFAVEEFVARQGGHHYQLVVEWRFQLFKVWRPTVDKRTKLSPEQYAAYSSQAV